MPGLTYAPLYSGPGKSGICICGHSWEDHHLMLVARQAYVDATHEGYIPGECEAYGSNECGGLMPGLDGEWIDHCRGYRDQGA